MSEVLFSVSTAHALDLAKKEFEEIVEDGKIVEFENVDITMNPHNKNIQLQYQAIAYCPIEQDNFSWMFNIVVDPELEIVSTEFEDNYIPPYTNNF